MNNLISTVFFLVLSYAVSCSGGQERTIADRAGQGAATAGREKLTDMVGLSEPVDGKIIRTGDQLVIKTEALDGTGLPDSVVVSYNGKRAGSIVRPGNEMTVTGALINTTGKRALKLTPFRDGKAGRSITRFVTVMSDVEPLTWKYRVIRSYPHDKEAYTQGFFYHKGYFYEGTGQETRSSLREVEPETGRIRRQLNLSSNLFGEGITMVGDLIYQVTWQNKVGFVYRMDSFTQLRKIYYQTEGWGLTTAGDRIIMSDGTNNLYFIEPEMFTTVSQIEVYDNSEAIDSLNELEFVEGEIWANIWLTDKIARIDPASGRVLGYIDLTGLLVKDQRDKPGELNGIAYDPATKRIFVTGKNWPLVFEIGLTK